MAIQLNIAKIKGRLYKFGIVAGASILGKYKTEEQANTALTENRPLFQYWAESASVSVDNSKKIIVIL